MRYARGAPAALVERWRHPPYWSRPCCGERQPQARASDAMFPTSLTVLFRRRRTVSLNLLMTPMVRKFPVGQLAVYLGLLPDVKYSVENGRAHGQRAGVIVFKFAWVGRIYRMILWAVGWCILLSSGGGTAKGGPKACGGAAWAAGYEREAARLLRWLRVAIMPGPRSGTSGHTAENQT